MPSLLLRTFQRLDRVEQLRREGSLTGDWDRVTPGTERAYARMVTVMAEYGIDTEGRPPIWAWHGTLRLLDADLLFDAEHELSCGYATVTFAAPAELVLLCDYVDWCAFLLRDAGKPTPGWHPTRQRGDQLHPEQACLPYLLARWVTSVVPLPTSGWDDVDLDTVV